MANNRTIFQSLSKVIGGGSGNISPSLVPSKTVHTYNINPNNDIIFSTKDKTEFETKKLQTKQEKLLALDAFAKK